MLLSFLTLFFTLLDPMSVFPLCSKGSFLHSAAANYGGCTRYFAAQERSRDQRGQFLDPGSPVVARVMLA